MLPVYTRNFRTVRVSCGLIVLSCAPLHNTAMSCAVCGVRRCLSAATFATRHSEIRPWYFHARISRRFSAELIASRYAPAINRCTRSARSRHGVWPRYTEIVSAQTAYRDPITNPCALQCLIFTGIHGNQINVVDEYVPGVGLVKKRRRGIIAAGGAEKVPLTNEQYQLQRVQQQRKWQQDRQNIMHRQMQEQMEHQRWRNPDASWWQMSYLWPGARPLTHTSEVNDMDMSSNGQFVAAASTG